MESLHLGRVVVGLVFFIQLASAQISVLPYSEHFDTIADSTIPPGWETSMNRRLGGDFFASLSVPHSTPHCLYSQNSIISQTLTSPAFDFSDRFPDKIQFYTARSSTHLSGIVMEASVDGGLAYPISLCDTLKNPGTTAYVLSSIPLPACLANRNGVRFRWRVVGGIGGATATFRIDDVSITALVSNDLAIGSIEVLPRLATSQDSLVLSVSVKNLGLQYAANYSVNFFCDLNGNSKPEPSEQFASATGVPLLATDSVFVTVGHSKLKAGDYRFFAIVAYPGDERSSNDTAVTNATIGYPKGCFLVNEFMYAPSGDEPEWVEMLNCSTDTVNLKNWRISDNNTSTKTVIASNNILIPPTGYCIVAKDANFILLHPTIQCPVVIANFAALNNTTPDAIVLCEPRLTTIDSVAYSQTWGGQGGKSLERIDAEQSSTDAHNWGQSEDSAGSSPGQMNSIVRMANDLKIDRCFQSPIQSPAGLIPQVSIVVRNAGKLPAANYTLTFWNDLDHDSTGESDEIIASLNPMNSLSASDSAVYTFTWESIPQGESTVLISVDFASDQRPRNNRSSIVVRTSYSPRSVVVNEIMFDPLPNQNEWVELFNRSSSPVDLKQWKLRDRPTASGSLNCFTIANQSTIVRGGEFALIAALSCQSHQVDASGKNRRHCRLTYQRCLLERLRRHRYSVQTRRTRGGP